MANYTKFLSVHHSALNSIVRLNTKQADCTNYRKSGHCHWWRIVRVDGGTAPCPTRRSSAAFGSRSHPIWRARSGGDPVAIRHVGQEWTFSGEHGIHAIWGQYHNFRAFLAREQIAPGYIKARRELWIHRAPGGRIKWSEGGSLLRSSWIPAPFHY